MNVSNVYTRDSNSSTKTFQPFYPLRPRLFTVFSTIVFRSFFIKRKTMASPEESVVDQSPSETTSAPQRVSCDITPMNAVIIGGTGAIGRCLVGVLLRDKIKFGKVTVVGRRKVDTIDEQYGVNLQNEEANGRLVQVEQDMDAVNDEMVERICTGVHVLFCCLGTTRKAAGSAERFHQIDYDIPLKFAKAAKAVGVSHYSLVSSTGAKASSIILYLRTKGEIEDAVIDLRFNYTTILRPGLLDRGAENRRFMEKITSFFFKPMPVGTVAEAMAIDSYDRYNSTELTTSEDDVTIATSMMLDNTGIYQIVQKQLIGSSVDPPQPAVEERESEKTDEEPAKIEEPKEQEPKEQGEQPLEQEQEPLGEQVVKPSDDEEPTDVKQDNEQSAQEKPKESINEQETESDKQPPAVNVNEEVSSEENKENN